MRPLRVGPAAQRFLDLDPVFIADRAERLSAHLDDGGNLHGLRTTDPELREIAIQCLRILRRAGLRCRANDLPRYWHDWAHLVERAQAAALHAMEKLRASEVECDTRADTEPCFQRREWVRYWYEAERAVVYLFAVWLARERPGPFSDPFDFIKPLRCFEGYSYEPA